MQFQTVPMFIDSHCHLDDAAFDADRAAMLTRAHQAGVSDFVVPAVDAAGWQKLHDLAAADASLHPAYGLHPMFLEVHRPEHLPALAAWLREHRSVAVGECGLDYYVADLDPAVQVEYFTGQLRIARDLELPVIIHARRSVDDIIKYVRRFAPLTGVVHSFAGSEQQARKLIELGFCLSFGGPLTYDRARRLQKLVATLPIESLLLETDAPDQPDSAHRGMRNEPAWLPGIAARMAELRGMEIDALARQTAENTRRLFRLPH
ncbi:MAG: TatD family hydrolase [Gammaproteobacteria bacterium]|jgi:TatD DNase family protein